VAFVGGKRRLQIAYPQKAPVQPYAAVRPGGTWVLTGGCRGITAECAMELGKRFGLKLHLVGTSPRQQLDEATRDLSPEELKNLRMQVMREARAAGKSMEAEWSRVQKQIEIDRWLRAFAAEGVDATYHACDVADRDALAAVLETVRRTSGPIEGIVHGAGIERSAGYERKARESVMATIGAKVDGAMNLMRLTANDPVRHFIGFGSISGRLGSNGQTDYCLASDALCKLAGWYRTQRPGVHSVGFHWHPWAEVGMAARPESTTMLRISDGPTHMPKREGVEHFIRELYAGTPDSEIIITTWDYHGRYYTTKHHPKRAEAAEPTRQADAEVSPELWGPWPLVPIARRLETQMVEAPLPADAPAEPRWQGPACILGNNPAATALRDRLQAAGVTVHMLPVSTSAEQATGALEAIYNLQPPRYLFLMSGRDEVATALPDRAAWQERRARGVAVPFHLGQHWFRLRAKAKDKTPVTIVAATALGGDFGLSHNVAAADGAALAGMLKSVYIEDSRGAESEVRVKVIDLPGDEPPVAVVDAICRELAAADPNVEVGWSKGRRSVPRTFERPIESFPRRSVPRGLNWVVTGGARGITAATAFELARRYAFKLHVIGRSPAPCDDAPWRNCNAEQFAQIKAQTVREAVNAGRSPEKEWERIRADIEIDATLKKFAAAGVQATYYQCDLSDWDALAAVLEQIRRDGPIEGILHGAGYGKSARFGARSVELFERTLAGKLDGGVALMSLTRQDPLRYFIGFGSIGGRFGGNGLADYGAANDMFAKLCAWYKAQRPDCAVCCFDWQSWDEVGMAMVGDSAVGTKSVLKMAFIPPGEGIEHVCRELEAGLPTSEVVISDGFFERTFYPFAVAAASDDTATTRQCASPAAMPLVEKIGPLDGRGSEAEIVFDPTVDPFLIDHQFRGRPLLPAVIALEAIAEAARLAAGKPVAAIRDVQLLEGLPFHTERKIAARVRAIPAGDNRLTCELVSDFRNRADKLIQKDRVHVRATVELINQPMPLSMTMGAVPTEWRPFRFDNIGPMRHGPTLHGLTGTTFDERGGWGQLVSLPLSALGGTRVGRDWLVPATLLDAAFYACGTHAWFHANGAFTLPSSLELVRLGRMPSDHEKCLVEFTCRELRPEHAIYDFTIFGEDRSAILRVEGHRIAMVRP
jgi:NAD(P)-dependent dehydrogenase (short-subunit alcohol dehydrogenase family)